LNNNIVIPRVRFEINSDDPLNGVKTISLVDEPAIESDFIFFNKASKNKFIELKGENFKQVVAGLALIPDKDILRFDNLGEPYFGYFTKDSIEQIRNKFHKELLTNQVNTDHNSNNYIDAFLIESFIIDSEERLSDVKAKGIEEATIGSWYVAYKIEDKETFQRVLNGELKGFSVEIFLQRFHRVIDKNNLINNFNEQMNDILKKFKELLSELEQNSKEDESKKFETAKNQDGATVQYTVVGEPVLVVADDGSTSPAPDGDYILDNGFTISVASGVLTAITETPVQQSKEDGEFEKVKNELQKVKEEKENLSKEINTLKQEIEKLKKTPLVNPVFKQEKTQEVDLSKLSNADKFRLKYNIKK
jgi:hypothetical protein